MTPDGLISHLGGPFEGPMGDWVVWRETGLENRLRILNEGVQGEDWLYLYGDPAYTASYGIIGPFKANVRRQLNIALHEMNAHISSLQISVEHGFRKIMQLRQFNGHENYLKIVL